jgi:hypothetical protein
MVRRRASGADVIAPSWIVIVTCFGAVVAIETSILASGLVGHLIAALDAEDVDLREESSKVLINLSIGDGKCDSFVHEMIARSNWDDLEYHACRCYKEVAGALRCPWRPCSCCGDGI